MSDVKEIPAAGEAENETFEDANDENSAGSMTQESAGATRISQDQDSTSKRQSQADSAKALDDEEAEALKNVEEVDQSKSEDAVHTQGGSPASTDRGAPTDTTAHQGNQGVTKVQLSHLQPVLSPDADDSTPTSPPTKRKLFGWLQRTTSSNDKASMRLPSLPFRGAPVPQLAPTEEDPIRSPTHESPINKRSSLQDRFKTARLREEAGVDIEGLDDFLGRPQSVGVPQSPQMTTAARNQRANSLAGPSSPVKAKAVPEEPVDWDLWQDVVYEGPAAVSRRSSKELSEAITHGIPSAIRGVVWQVLAQSKDDNLEAIYRSLVARQGGEGIPPTDHRAKPKLPPRKAISGPFDKTSRRLSTQSTTLEQPETIILAESSDLKTADDPAVKATIPEEDPVRNETESAVPEPLGIDDAQVMDKLTIQKLERAIRRDMGTRTSYSKFLMSAGLQEGLFGICKAYALYDEDVGYAQGMNFIAMPLLFNMPEEEAFCLFVRLMNHYHLRDQFVRDMPGLHLHLYQFDRLLEDMEPAVYCHLHRRGVSSQLYATQWFLTLFAYRFPLQLVLRIYDLILSEGLESAILKFGIVLMQKNAEQILKMKDMLELTTFLKDRIFDIYIDRSPSANSLLESGFFGSASGGVDKEVYKADALVQDACAIKVTPEMLKTYTKEWEEKVRDEKEKEASEEALRTNNATLTTKVRSLEVAAEKSDTEHVQTASELVRIKVENQQLTDENESLKMQVQQLQTIVDAQPKEVEDRLREEMERIMTRNIEVQNENRSLEESTAEMEKELVSAKMQWAEINSELEGMRQKWQSMTALMNAK